MARSGSLALVVRPGPLSESLAAPVLLRYRSLPGCAGGEGGVRP